MAVVLYTSGTTGNPKGVALRQRNLLCNAWSMAQNFGLDATTQLAVLPLYHAHAFGFGLMTALSTGGHLVFTERLEPFTWAEVIRAESVAVTSVVPTLLPMLLAAGVTREKVPTLRAILVSSAPLPRDLARDFEARTRIPLIQGWGLSEYTNFACCLSPDAPAEEHARADVRLGGAVDRPGARGHRGARRRPERRAGRRGRARRARRSRPLDDARLLPGPGEHGADHRRRGLAAHRRRGLLPAARAAGPSSSSPGA